MYRCSEADDIRVMSDSSTKVYHVSFAGVMPTCTCPAFAIGRNRAKSVRTNINPNGPQQAYCKHIDRNYDKVCHWRGEPLIPGFLMCPECGGKLVECEEMSVENLFK